MINKLAVFTDETENFVTPYAPSKKEKVRFKIRVGKKDFTKIRIIFDNNTYEMKKEKNDKMFDFFGVSILVLKNATYYYELENKEGTVFYYNRNGISNSIDHNFDFQIVIDFKVPEWSRGAVMYQIFIDRFCNGDPSNDVETDEYMYRGKEFINNAVIDKNEYVKKAKDWYELPDVKDNTKFYGGDLQGVMDKLEYLKELGVEAVYFNPIFVSPSNHRYDTQDYEYVDPHIGKIVSDKEGVLDANMVSNSQSEKYIERVTNFDNLKASNELLRMLIQKAHSLGIKVILDGVFNHCGSFNKWLDREKIYYEKAGYENGAFIDKNSPYVNYFKFREEKWPYNLSYDKWWDYEELPKLHYEGSEELYHYVMSVARKWIADPYQADGWRLDVAADLGYSKEFNHQFWKDFRKSVKTANRDAVILAEHYENPSEWLRGDEWDTIMNYEAFMEPVSYYFTGMEKHSDKEKKELLGGTEIFINTMKWFQGQMPIQSLETAMNQISNHDHSRFLTRTNRTIGRIYSKGTTGASMDTNKGILKEATVLQMTWPGAPTIYYGDEAGLTGWTDPDNRRTYPWGREDHELLAFYKKIIEIHKRYRALKTGSLIYLVGDYNILSYARFNENEKVIVIFNNNEYPKLDLVIPVWMVEIPDESKLKKIFATDVSGFYENTDEYVVFDGNIKISIPPFSSTILAIS